MAQSTIRSRYKTVEYPNEQITWYSTTNPFFDYEKDVSLEGYTPVAFDWTINVGSQGTFVFPYRKYIEGNTLRLGIRMLNNQQPGSTTQNKMKLKVLYMKN